MPNAVKYWNGSSWQSSQYFGKTKMWDGSSWRMVDVKYAGGAGTSYWNVPAGTLDSQTVTVGYYSYTDFDAGYSEAQSGYGGSAGGSISDGTSNIYGGASIQSIYYSYTSLYSPPESFVLEISGSRSNSGWTTLTAGSLSLSRASAIFNDFGTSSQWVWFNPSTNPFGTTAGTQVQVIFS